MIDVSILIPVYNREKLLSRAIRSCLNQDIEKEKIEIIVINDCSKEQEYYNYDWNHHDIRIIHLEQNTSEIFGFPNVAHVRNTGIENAKGKYVAFCDDDDIWLPNKIELQLKAMKTSGCKMSSTDGLIGYGVYNESSHYKKYNAEYYYSTLFTIYENHSLSKFKRFIKKFPGIGKLIPANANNKLKNGFPEIWNLAFIKIHNCIITSSVLIEKSVLDKINNFRNVRMREAEDYDCWLRALEHTDCVYVKDLCFYYDMGHGSGQNY